MASQAIMSALADLFPSVTLPVNIPPAQAATITTHPSSVNASHATDSQSLSAGNLSPFAIPSLLFSLAVNNKDVLKLVLIGGLIETFRRLADRVWNWLMNTWFITAYFDNSDDTFSWMMIWLAKQNVWANAREVHISTASWGQAHHKGVVIPEGNTGFDDGNGFQAKRRLAYLPAYGTTHWLRYKGTWMSVSRSRQDARDAWTGRKEESIELCLLTRDHRVLRSLLLDAKNLYKADDDDTVDIYGVDSGNCWYRTSTRKKRPLRSIILEPEIKHMILDDAKEFLSTEKWYTDRGIPYRRGYLLHGVPGSGKTSLIHSIAGELDLDIFVVSLAKKGLDDSGLNELICGLPSRCIALMEDIDAAFHHAGIARDGVSDTSNKPTPQVGPPAPPTKEQETRGVTLSGLLGALDGVAAQEGRILFATTNRYNSLDEALCRAGRMDIHVEFKKATRWQAKELFRRFYPPAVSEEKKEDEVISVVSAVSAVSERFKAGGNAKGGVLEKPSRAGQEQLTQEETDVLAERFSDVVPEGQFSMASLQGHLMRFKERPHDAVNAALEWVEQESRKRGVAVRPVKVEQEKEVIEGNQIQSKAATGDQNKEATGEKDEGGGGRSEGEGSEGSGMVVTPISSE